MSIGAVLDQLRREFPDVTLSKLRFLLDRDVTLAGRNPEADIFLDDVTVSRRHVEFRRTGSGGFEVVDLGSLNGTYVNREPRNASALSSGDEIQIGKFRLVFVAGPGEK